MRAASPVRGLLPALTVLLAGGALAAYGIESHPLSFAKRASPGTAKGSIHGRQTIDDKLRAPAGQTMSVTLKSGNPGLAFNVLPPGSGDVAIPEAIARQSWSGASPADGEYTTRTYLVRAAARRKGELHVDGGHCRPFRSRGGRCARVGGHSARRR